MEKEDEQAQHGEKECKGNIYQPIDDSFHSTFFSVTNVDIFCACIKFCHRIKTICVCKKIEMQNFEQGLMADTFVTAERHVLVPVYW